MDEVSLHPFEILKIKNSFRKYIMSMNLMEINSTELSLKTQSCSKPHPNKKLNFHTWCL
jgi:hypothetical protein